jgi:phosphate-selective porin OprO/OprP
MNGGLGKINRFLLAGASVIGLLAIGTPEAKAQGAQDLQQIQAQIEQMQATIKALQKQVQDAQAQAAAATTAAESANGSDIDLKVKWKGAPEFSSSDGKFKMKVRGRLMVDYNGIDQDRKITGEGDINAVEMRRARLGVEGVVFYDWKYKFEIDFAADEVALKDAYVAYANWWKDIELSEIRAGNQYVYTSLEQITSSRFITFMERASFIDAFLPSVEADRQIGLAVVLGNEHWSFQSGYYGASVGPANDIDGQEEFDFDKMAASVRGTWAPINREVNGVNQVLHLGASYRHRDAGTLNECSDFDNNGSTRCIVDGDEFNALFQYRAKGADLHLADRFVDTPQFSKADDMFILEAAFVWGPFSMQGEYAQLEADGVAPFRNQDIASAVDPTYDGWYVDASWYLTGETRTYEADEGIFGRPKVKRPLYGGSGGWGAWQIAGRYDVINLGDDAEAMNLAYGCSECGDQKTWLIGVNWWWTDYTALKLNVNWSEITGGNNAPQGSGSGFNRNDGAEIWGVGLRAQVDW